MNNGELDAKSTYKSEREIGRDINNFDAIKYISTSYCQQYYINKCHLVSRKKPCQIADTIKVNRTGFQQVNVTTAVLLQVHENSYRNDTISQINK